MQLSIKLSSFVIAIVLLLGLCLNANADYSDALQNAAKARQYVFLRFTGTWCQPCKQFEINTLNNPLVTKKLQDFFVYTCDVDREPQVWSAYSKQFKVQGIPTYFVVHPTKEWVYRVGTGNRNPQALIEWIDNGR